MTPLDTYSRNLIKLIEDAAKKILPSRIKKNHENEPWKDDEMLNSLLPERSNVNKNRDLHKQLSIKIKKRTQYIRNGKMQQEPARINLNATKRQVGDLFRIIKADGLTFKVTKRGYACDSDKLRNFS